MRAPRWTSAALAALLTMAGLAGLAGPAGPARAADEAAPTLTVATWGGVYAQAQRAALFDPFTAATGIPVETARHDGGVAILSTPEAEGWDVIDMIDADAATACAAGLLQPLDTHALAAPAPDGTPAAADFLPGSFGRCGLAHLTFSTVVAYDDRAFPGRKPRTIADVFDIETFPGTRAFRREPDALLEWALMAEGVPRAQVYDLLSTDRGLRLALRKLDTIRDHIVWWQGGEEPVRLLASGAVAMASGYNGRFFDARVAGDLPIVTLWDGQLLNRDVWAIPAGSDAPDAARAFIRFATHPDRLAALGARIPYGPARRSALDRIGLHPDTGVPMAQHLPTAPHRIGAALAVDSDWDANTKALRRRRFEAWLARGGDDRDLTDPATRPK
ncbi:extracellular solute-binding protein [Roseospira navarrensis]|uniref:Extracellular solute-binding protein n=1 Tax=Roseospira navarrensis TaxID=140058 RepID=A0A7X1ZCL4_9PROT|nr:extracellular solute-binding protein [Roseospira navarrensis]MQX35071.1 extracellular solute-binding protein [Roseospira navarrensis]